MAGAYGAPPIESQRILLSPMIPREHLSEHLLRASIKSCLVKKSLKIPKHPQESLRIPQKEAQTPNVVCGMRNAECGIRDASDVYETVDLNRWRHSTRLLSSSRNRTWGGGIKAEKSIKRQLMDAMAAR